MSTIGTCPRSFCTMSIQRCPCLGIGAETPGQALSTYSSIAASAHNWQLVHSATSMIRFHFSIIKLPVYPQEAWGGLAEGVIRRCASDGGLRLRLIRPTPLLRRQQLGCLQGPAHLRVLFLLREGCRHMLGAA